VGGDARIVQWDLGPREAIEKPYEPNLFCYADSKSATAQEVQKVVDVSKPGRQSHNAVVAQR
jgi:hypothetical protein